MQTQLDVVYDGETLIPSRPLNLPSNRHYSVTITDDTSKSQALVVTASPSESDLEELAWSIYDNRLKSRLEPEQNGNVVAIDLDTEDYEVAPRSLPAWKALKTRRPKARIVFIVIGPVSQDSPLARRLNRTMPRKEAAT